MSTTPIVSAPPSLAPRLEHRFADALPELALSWRAEEAPDPRLLVLNEPLAAELGLDVDWLRSPGGVRFLVGGAVPEGATPVAQVYAGHQFGGYSPRLGDGRALLLGELGGPDGRLRDLHLKGSGRTPFARGGDGRAAVGPMLREYVVSEALHALGIPTTRSLAVVATGRTVAREVPLPGAVMTRVAASHLRVGSFQYARATDASGEVGEVGEAGLVRRLVDHAIARHHPGAADAEDPALALLAAVAAAQASLVASWMNVGFVHGVLNTDNVTISGESIDFGPCAFLDAFDPTTWFSSIDEGGRYAYDNQPPITEWNLARFAETLLPVLGGGGLEEHDAISRATDELHRFRDRYAERWSAGLRAKAGLATGPAAGLDEAVVVPLLDELTDLMRGSQVDHTGWWRDLAGAARGHAEPLRERVLDLTSLDDWLGRWRALDPDADAMDRVNPVVVPRNHLVEEALVAGTGGDLAPVERLVDAVRHPFEARPGFERYADPAPESFGSYTTYCGT